MLTRHEQRSVEFATGPKNLMGIREKLKESPSTAAGAAAIFVLVAVAIIVHSYWPEKKADLESKLVAVTTLPAQAERQWQGSLPASWHPDKWQHRCN